MADIEKVVKGLYQHCECSLFDRCGECPYYETDYDSWEESKFKCRDKLLDDALELLKEQEEEIENLKQTAQSMMEGTCLLKEQEVKTGYWIDSAGNDKCSICGEEYSDLYPDYGNTHFCPNCGAKMKGR